MHSLDIKATPLTAFPSQGWLKEIALQLAKQNEFLVRTLGDSAPPRIVRTELTSLEISNTFHPQHKEVLAKNTTGVPSSFVDREWSKEIAYHLALISEFLAPIPIKKEKTGFP